jgi:hypothetical protein
MNMANMYLDLHEKLSDWKSFIDPEDNNFDISGPTQKNLRIFVRCNFEVSLKISANTLSQAKNYPGFHHVISKRTSKQIIRIMFFWVQTIYLDFLLIFFCIFKTNRDRNAILGSFRFQKVVEQKKLLAAIGIRIHR